MVNSPAFLSAPPLGESDPPVRRGKLLSSWLIKTSVPVVIVAGATRVTPRVDGLPRSAESPRSCIRVQKGLGIPINILYDINT
jgi:hypothetical protein